MHTNPNIQAMMECFPFEALTFDDVSLETQYADFLPDEADISTRLTTRIRLSLPFLSAAMDTVTEEKMAISMAMQGGIGVVHKNLSIPDQVACVAKVKNYLNGLISSPVVFRHTNTVREIQEAREKNHYGFSGFPILDDDNMLVGIVTAADLKFVQNTSVKVSEVMTSSLVTAPAGTGLLDAYNIMIKRRVGKLPLVTDGNLVGLYSFTDVKTLVEREHPLYNRDDKYRLRAAAAVGPWDRERAERLADAEVDVMVVDSAHGHSHGVVEMTRWIAKHFPAIDIVAGNVATGEGALALRAAGAHAVKVGIGPGSICTTRVVCGVGIPQITAVYESAKALEGSIPIIADGGIRHSGDVPKALAAGADSVMLGSILAGTEESPGEKIIHQGRQYVVYRGMGSLAAMKQGAGARDRYSQSETSEDELVPQGIEGIVPYAGAVSKVMAQFAGGLRATLGYTGCRSIPLLQKQARMVRVSSAGLREAHPHDVKIMKEAPNYRS